MKTAEPKSLQWRCLDCRRGFHGPVDKAPSSGCIYCGSRSVVDINTEPHGRPIHLRITPLRRKP